MGTKPWYCTREEVKASLSMGDTARADSQVDRAIEDASRSIEKLTHRRFYPEIDTRYFDWPNEQYARSWRLWLDENEVISVSALTSGGTLIGAPDYILEPNGYGPPYTSIDLDLGGSASFGGGDTFQQSIGVTGVFGYQDDQQAVGATAEALDTTETGVDVTDGSVVGVGDLLLVDSERLLVTGRGWLTTTQTLQTPMTAVNNNVTVAVMTGSAYFAGEQILLDSERMLITDVAGNNLTVKRAQDGTVLATHTGSTIYASRTLTVLRGAVGTTAANHLTAAPLSRLQSPARSLCVAEAMYQIMQESGGYGKQVGNSSSSADLQGSALQDLRDRFYRQFGRRGRSGAI